MNRFNLEFAGEILPERDPARVKARFGRFFAIDDPQRLERFFSGRTIVLRRNLEKKTAAEYFVSLRRLGVEARLVRATEDESGASDTPSPAATAAAPARKAPADTASEPNRSAPAVPGRESGPGNRRGRQTARQKALEKKAVRKKARKAARRATRPKRQPQAPVTPPQVNREQREAEAQAAREKALREETARRAAEEAARQQALAEAERQRREAEEAQRRKTLQEEIARKAAEEAARQRAIEEVVQRQREAQEAERRRREADEAQRRKALREVAAREAAEKEAAVQRGRRDADYARRRALQAMEDQAMRRAATALAQPALKPAAPRPKADVSIAPLLKARRPATAPAAKPRRRQPGAPNIYSLSPFRNTPQVRNRSTQARRRMRNGMKLAVAALAALLLLGGRFLSLPAPEILSGASAVAVDASLRPVMIAGDRLLLHDRSGTGAGEIGLETLGLSALQAPIAFEPGGDLLGMGRLADAPGAEQTDAPQLLRCSLEPPVCRPFAPETAGVRASALAIHPLTRAVFAADVNSGQLLRFSADGELQASAPLAMPAQPVLRLDSGLLFMNSSQGPAISVFRYEDDAFGRQLDEILLLPPQAVSAEQSRARDLLWSGGSWWVTLDNPETGSAGIYRFDAQWDLLGQVALAPGERPGRLVAWGEKVLLLDSGQVPVQRFSAQGGREAPFVSQPLQALVEGQEQYASLSRMAWRAGLTLCAILALLGLGYAYLQHLRALVYRPRRERGADPVDERADAVEWVDPVNDRDRVLRQRTVHYGLLAVALLLLAVGVGVTTTQLAALLVALSGPAVALALLRRSPAGHIGVLQRELVLADHAGTYHLGSGARIQHRGNLLMIDDVLVFAGNRLLPAFDPAQVASRVKPLVQAGVRVDRKTALVKLLQSRHPFARGAIAVLLALLAAAALVSLPG